MRLCACHAGWARGRKHTGECHGGQCGRHISQRGPPRRWDGRGARPPILVPTSRLQLPPGHQGERYDVELERETNGVTSQTLMGQKHSVKTTQHGVVTQAQDDRGPAADAGADTLGGLAAPPRGPGSSRPGPAVCRSSCDRTETHPRARPPKPRARHAAAARPSTRERLGANTPDLRLLRKTDASGEHSSSPGHGVWAGTPPSKEAVLGARVPQTRGGTDWAGAPG